MRYLVLHIMNDVILKAKFETGSRAYRVLTNCVGDPDLFEELHYDSQKDKASGRIGTNEWWHVERRELQ